MPHTKLSVVRFWRIIFKYPSNISNAVLITVAAMNTMPKNNVTRQGVNSITDCIKEMCRIPSGAAHYHYNV